MADQKPDFAHGYVEQVRAHEVDYRRWRDSGVGRSVEVPGRRRPKRICDLTDREIAELSRREAEVDAVRGINEWNESVDLRKHRRGEAI